MKRFLILFAFMCALAGATAAGSSADPTPCHSIVPTTHNCWHGGAQAEPAGIPPKYITCHPGNRMVRCICVQWDPTHRFCWRVEWVPPDPPAPPETVCGINCDPGGYPPSYCQTARNYWTMWYQGHEWECRFDRSNGQHWSYNNTVGYLNGCPEIYSPCWYWHPFI